MLSSGTNVIICDKMLSSGANVMMVSSGANVIIWCYHVMLSSGMITHPFFIFPENFTHSFHTQLLSHTNRKTLPACGMYKHSVGGRKNAPVLTAGFSIHGNAISDVKQKRVSLLEQRTP